MTRRLLLAILLFALIPVSYAEEDVYRACTNLVYAYAYNRDNFNADAFADLFTADASLTVVGTTWVGKDDIRQRIEGLKNGSTIRHEMSTILITPIDADHARGVSYATIWSAPAGETSVSGFALMGEYHDDFVRTAEGWKIAKRVLVQKYSRAQ
jgi:uncharacterized protein (TIGR02246 family)